MKTSAHNPKKTRGEDSTRVYTPARIIALALIAMLAIGLAYLRFAPGSPTVTVPAGAQAGDLILESGTYQTEKGPYAADYGTLVVPENRADPGSRLIALPVVRIRATSDHPAEPIFRLEGGPGITNMTFEQASRYTGNHDVVLVGYRGVDGSVRLDAPEVESALSYSRDVLSDESMTAYAEAFRAAAERWKAEGVDLAGYTATQQVEDLEAARAALGYDRIDLVSESAGTRTAMIYSWRYPESIHRSIMIGVNPPGNFMWDAKTADEQIGRYAAQYAREDESARRTDDLAETLHRTNTDMPDRWLFLLIKKGNVRATSFMGMMESTSKAGPFNAPLVLDAWLSAAEGDASGLWATTLVSDLLFPKMFVWGEYAGFGRIDAQAARDYFSSDRSQPVSNLGAAASSFIWGGGRLADAVPADPNEEQYSQVRTSEVETLLIGGELDLSTPPQIATKELLPYLPNGHQVVLAGIGHSGSFWHSQSDAGTRLINTFLDTGRVDDSLYEPGKVDFTPDLTFTRLAKYIAGAMVGVALLAVLSLLGMARRVHKRGAFGRKAGVVLRSVFPGVLGLGGWFLGALVVLSTMPGMPLDDELLSAFSVGLPIGLGIYLAWVDRDWSTTTKSAGFAAAAGGALIGACLGFNATEGLLAIFTAIAGAAGGANLAILALDIAWDGQVSARCVEANVRETLEARPSTS